MDLFNTILMCALPPLSLVLFILLGKKFTKYDKESVQEQKDFLWLKIQGSNKQLEENNCSFGYRFVMSFCFVSLVFLLFTLVYGFDLYKFNFSNEIYSISGCFTAVGLLASAVMVISLVLANKKDFYLGINAKDVVSQSHIPSGLANMYSGTAYLFLGYFLSNVAVPYEEIIKLVQLWIYASACYILVNLMMVIQQTIQLCLSVDQKELGVLRCFRRRIIDVVKLDEKQTVSEVAVEKITAYLLKECRHRLKQSKTNIEHLKSVRLYSAVSNECEKTCLKRLKAYADGLALLMVGTIGLPGIVNACMIQNRDKTIIVLWVMILLTIALYIYGCWGRLWLLFFSARYYYVFSVSDTDSGKTENKIAEWGNPFSWSKRYEAVGLMEDLLGFYKMLLYNKRGRKYRYVVINQVVSKIDERNATVRNALLLLLYYAEYEKIYLKLKSDKKRKNLHQDNLLGPDEKLVQAVNREVKKRRVIDYDLLNNYIDFDTISAAEYQLADAILSEIYKEPFVRNGSIVPDQLWNYKFECFYEHIQRQ